MGGEDRGGLPDLDPDLSKSRGGHPDPDLDLSKSRGGHPDLSKSGGGHSKTRDEKVGENRDSGYIPIYPDLFGQKNREKSGYILILPDLGSKVRENQDIS